MRVLHTSDWHIGRTLYGRERYGEFEAFLDWLVVLVEEENIDVLLVAGDVFDNSTPGNHAQELYYRFLCRVAASSNRHVVVTAGNHDSPSFLNAPRELLKCLNVHVVGCAADPPADDIRYSGSPLPIGFGEAEEDKCVVLVEFSGHLPQGTNMTVPRFQELKTLRGDWPAIAREIDGLKSRRSRAWLEIVYEWDEVAGSLRGRLDDAVAFMFRRFLPDHNRLLHDTLQRRVENRNRLQRLVTRVADAVLDNGRRISQPAGLDITLALSNAADTTAAEHIKRLGAVLMNVDRQRGPGHEPHERDCQPRIMRRRDQRQHECARKTRVGFPFAAGRVEEVSCCHS